MATKKLTESELLRRFCKRYDLSFTQIHKTLGIPSEWMNRMIMDNKKYRFINPNPERMARIWEYAKAWRDYKTAERIRFNTFQSKWQR